jgi:hypothetical protein
VWVVGQVTAECAGTRGVPERLAGKISNGSAPAMPLVSPLKNGDDPIANLIAGVHGGRQSGGRGLGSCRALRTDMASAEICCLWSARRGEKGGSLLTCLSVLRDKTIAR